MDVFLALLLGAVILIATWRVLGWAISEDRKYRRKGQEFVEEVEQWLEERKKK